MKYKYNVFLLFSLLTTIHCPFILRAEVNEGPDTVKIGTYLMSIHDINFRDKEYTIRFWMWMLYDNPEFDFTNKVEITNAKSLEKPDVIIDTINAKNWVLMKMKCQMKQSWQVVDYPFDKQNLEVHVENTEFDADNLIFVADTVGEHYDPDLTIEGWDITNIKITTSKHIYETRFGDTSLEKPQATYSSFNIYIGLARNAWGLFFKLFIGMYISFLIAVTSLFIYNSRANFDPGFGLPVGGLFAAVGNKYVIDSILPESSTFTLVDTLHAITFIFIFIIIVIIAFTMRTKSKGKDRKASLVNRYGRYIVIGTYIILNVTFVTLAIVQ